MGGGGLVITNGDQQKAEALAREMAVRFWARRFALEPPVLEPREAIARGDGDGHAPRLQSARDAQRRVVAMVSSARHVSSARPARHR